MDGKDLMKVEVLLSYQSSNEIPDLLEMCAGP